MTGWRCVLGLVVVLGCGSSTPAILIESDGKQYGGTVVKDDGTTLIVRIRGADGLEKDTSFLHDKIKIVHRLDVKRLEALSRDNPKAYRDYAEELARQEKDPEARRTALQLYLVAAKLERDTKVVASCLVGMSQLARTPAEARRFRALAFAADPTSGVELLKVDKVKPPPLDATEAKALDDFVKALQFYRAGRIGEAINAAQKVGVDKLFPKTPDKIDQKTFLQWCTDANCSSCKTGRVICPTCKGQGVVQGMFAVERCLTCKGTRGITCVDCGGWRVLDRLPADALSAVLRCELWALEQQSGGEEFVRKEPNEVKGWTSVLQSSRPAVRLSLDTIPGLNPNQCLYRNGRWVEDK